MEIKKGDCGHFCEACARRDDRIRELEAELAHVRAKLPDVPKRERECRTLDDWRCLALYYESEWRGCSDAFNKRAGDLKAELAALRQQQGEPIAWLKVNSYGDEIIIAQSDLLIKQPEWVQKEWMETGEPLYREAAPRAPEGWKLVPVEPTKEMQDAIAARMTYPQIERGYKAMLSAAPQPPDCKSEIQSGDESDNIKDIFSKT